MITTIVLDGERPFSWNQFYSGKLHWKERRKHVARVREVVYYAIAEQLGTSVDMYHSPVEIEFTSYLKGRMIDADNITTKLYVDGLVGILLEDDNPKFVRSVKSTVLKDKAHPRVVITIFPTKENE